MFKSISIYRIAALAVAAASIQSSLEAATFAPCGLTQAASSGWVPPRGHEHGALLESVGGQWVLKLMTETRRVPSDAVQRLVAERVKQIEQATGRKPGKKETRDLRDDALLELLPQAFTKRMATWVWIDPVAKLVVIDSASQGRLDEVLTMLARSIEGLSLVPLQTGCSPSAIMSAWLMDGDKLSDHDRFGFAIDRECELRATDESKAVVRYSNHALDIEEVQQHIQQGKVPTRLALTWMGKVSFVLTDSLRLKSLTFGEAVLEGRAEQNEDRFDADVAITTGELAKLIPDLIAALGDELAVNP